MPYSRRYTLPEVRGMMQIYRNNRRITARDGNNQVRSNAPSHAHIHGGSNYQDLLQRVNTPNEPRKTSTYWTEEDQAVATLEVLNSMAGQIALSRLDIGEVEVPIWAGLTPMRYRIAVAYDHSNMPGQPGHLGKRSPERVQAGATQVVSFATKGFVKVVPGIAGQLQIQTSFPEA